MNAPPMFDELAQKLKQLAETSPLKDFEKNAKALLGSMFERMDLVTREEFEAQRELVIKLRQELAELERRVGLLEAQVAGGVDED